MQDRKGFFITVESIDGVGKSTQIEQLKNYFKFNQRTYFTKEPGGSNIGSGIRSLLFKDPTANNMVPAVADLLFLADHMQNSYEISLFLDKDYTVISDRYADSQFAYYNPTGKNPSWTVDLYNSNYGSKPDLILFLRALDIETGWTLKRACARQGIEAGKQEGKPWNSLEEQIRIQSRYEERFRYNPNVVTINISESDTILMISSKIVLAIEESLALKNGYGSGV